jgi:LPS-assembly protein
VAFVRFVAISHRARMLNLFRFFCAVSLIVCAGPANAQLPTQPPAVPAPATPPASPPAGTPPAAPPVMETTLSSSREASNNQKDWHFIGDVEMDRGGDTKIYADDVWAYTGENRAIATGNVLFVQGNNRISAERAEFDTESRLGTFYNAWGLASVKPQPQSARPGAIAPTMTGQDTVIYFFGEKIEKIGPKKYKITNGGFSTCVQPTPRWDLNAGTVILNVDHYTLLKQAVLRVKGVPMFYLPILYYPTKREERATGFLIPTYGSSSLRGHSIHDAFFWAINRSQDATIVHDWFSKTGQGVGGEYRYNLGIGDGNLRAYMLDQHAATYAQPGTSPTTSAASRDFDIRGSAVHLLPGNIRARANVSYFSSLISSQTFNTSIYDLSRNVRSFGGNLVGAWGDYSMNATFDHSEYFRNATDSNLSGSWPRVSVNRNERPLLNSPAYFSLSTEWARVLRGTNTADIEVDTGLNRFDVSPVIRYPFKKWQWFTVNSTLNWRDTFYTRSYEPTGDPRIAPTKIVDVGLNRPVFVFQSQIVGPLFNRIWDTPNNGYAEKFKHSIEPFVTMQRTSSVDAIDRIVSFDGIDAFAGGTRYTYGINNRFYAKRVLAPGQQAQSREIFDVEVSQSYFTNQLASLYDIQNQTRPDYTQPVHFMPIALNIRALPTNEINATVRAEFDSQYRELRTISAQGSYSWTNRVQAQAGWSKKAFIEKLVNFNNKDFLDHSINGSMTVHTTDNRVGGIYSFNYDVLRSSLLQQSVSAFYNAQCCGLAFEYQTYDHSGLSSSPIAADHRFFLSFTLAGLGNFSPFNGALSGVPR